MHTATKNNQKNYYKATFNNQLLHYKEKIYLGTLGVK